MKILMKTALKKPNTNKNPNKKTIILKIIKSYFKLSGFLFFLILWRYDSRFYSSHSREMIRVNHRGTGAFL